MNALSESKEIDIREVINKPKKDEEIVTACDKLLTSLCDAENNAHSILKQLEYMKNEFNTNSTQAALFILKLQTIYTHKTTE